MVKGVAHRVADLSKEIPKSSAQPNVRELASRIFPIDPVVNLGDTALAPLSQYHDAPSKVIRVLENESQEIHPIQEIEKLASTTKLPKCG